MRLPFNAKMILEAALLNEEQLAKHVKALSREDRLALGIACLRTQRKCKISEMHIRRQQRAYSAPKTGLQKELRLWLEGLKKREKFTIASACEALAERGFETTRLKVSGAVAHALRLGELGLASPKRGAIVAVYFKI